MRCESSLAVQRVGTGGYICLDMAAAAFELMLVTRISGEIEIEIPLSPPSPWLWPASRTLLYSPVPLPLPLPPAPSLVYSTFNS